MKKEYSAPQSEIVKLEGTALMYTVNTGSGNGNGGIIPR